MHFDDKKSNGRGPKEREHVEDEESSGPIFFDEIMEEFMIRTRRVLVVGEINDVSSTHICNSLQLLSLSDDPLYMYINSPGGCLSSGYAIVDQMLACKCDVYTIVRGQGYSMGAIIAAFGTLGHRYSTPNSSMMLHSIIIHSPPSSIEHHNEITEYLRLDYERKVTGLAKRLKVNKKRLLKIMKKTEWMGPDRAMEIGLIDGIWTPKMERALNKVCKK